MDNLEDYLGDWILKLALPNDFNQGPRCPFAKSVWDSSRAKIVKCPNYDIFQFWETVSTECEQFDTTYDIAIIATDTIFDPFQLNNVIDALNIYLNTQNKDLWLLQSCNDHYSMVFIQRITEIDDASKILETLPYYNKMHPYEFIKSIEHRRKLRDNLQGNLVDKTT